MPVCHDREYSTGVIYRAGGQIASFVAKVSEPQTASNCNVSCR